MVILLIKKIMVKLHLRSLTPRGKIQNLGISDVNLVIMLMKEQVN